jgi:pilus assembly protein Flp/PilA
MLTFAKQLHMWLLVRNRGDEGATAVEYGLMVALIAGAIVGIVFALGGDLNSLFGAADEKVKTGTANMGATS